MLFGAQKKGNSLCLLYEIYHRVEHLINKYLSHFVAARNTRALPTQGELNLGWQKQPLINSAVVSASSRASVELAAVKQG